MTSESMVEALARALVNELHRQDVYVGGSADEFDGVAVDGTVDFFDLARAAMRVNEWA